MSKKNFFYGVIFFILFSFSSHTHAFDYGDPTPLEQLQLEAINRARLNPVAEALRFRIDLMEGVDPGAISTEPVPPLTMNADLLMAARLHSLNMLEQNYFSHSDSFGLDPFDRIKEAGYTYVAAGENIALRASTGILDPEQTALLIHQDLFVDKDYPHRGHRVNILNPTFKEIGVGIKQGIFSQNDVSYPYSMMVTCDFGASYDTRPFILGVVYEDTDNDGFYDPWEGIPEVEIKVLETGETYKTKSAGGYGFPVYSGSYTLKFAIDGLGSIEKTVSVGAQNVKLDIIANEIIPKEACNLSLTVSTNHIRPGTWFSTFFKACESKDNYVAIILPDRSFYSLTDKNTLSPPNKLEKFNSHSKELLNIFWPGDDNLEASEELILGAIAVEPGKDPFDPDNWLDVELVNLIVSY